MSAPAIPPYKTEFVLEALACGALRLGGPFRLKSGRLSPYFFDTSRFSTGRRIRALAAAYAHAMAAVLPGRLPDVLFGPAYKGIPLAVACAMQLERLYDHDAGYLFDRKEPKTHGENSEGEQDAAAEARRRLVGHPLEDGMRLVLLDDVLTTGDTKLEALELLRQAAPGAKIEGLLIALDRQEAAPDEGTAAQQFTQRTGVPVHAVLTATELLGVLRSRNQGDWPAVDALARYLGEQGLVEA
jgi:orotate phosphoribosyltransferase